MVAAKSVLLISQSFVEPCADDLGIVDNEWHAHGFFVHPAFIHQVVFTEKETLISRVDDDRVVEFSASRRKSISRPTLSSTPLTQRRYRLRYFW